MKTIDELVRRYPALIESTHKIEKAIGMIISCYENGGKLIVAGNGGSAADSDHIVGELMKGFVKKRPLAQEIRDKLVKVDKEIGAELGKNLQSALPAINLATHTALHTAFANDCDYSFIYAQMIMGLGKEGDIFIGITTSGNSSNILNAAVAAKAVGIKTIALTGGTGGKIKDIADISIIAPSKETFVIQEYHLPIYHAICLAVEEHFFKI